MPTTESDTKCNNKKKNIGNDFVTIVYNESGQEYDIQTVKVSTYFVLEIFGFTMMCIFPSMCTQILQEVLL